MKEEIKEFTDKNHMMDYVSDHPGFPGLSNEFTYGPKAWRQFNEWVTQDTEAAHAERMRDFEEKLKKGPDAFNERLYRRKLEMLKARPVVRIVRDWGTGCEIEIGRPSGCTGAPDRYFVVAKRLGEKDGEKYGQDIRLHRLPERVVINPRADQQDITVIASNSYARVESNTVRRGMTQVEESPSEKVPARVIDVRLRKRFNVEWGLAFGKYPGVDPSRGCGDLGHRSEDFPAGVRESVKTLFFLDQRRLRLQLAHGTEAEEFPDCVRVETSKGPVLFSMPGPAEKYSLGVGRDYEPDSGLGVIRVGESSMVSLEWIAKEAAGESFNEVAAPKNGEPKKWIVVKWLVTKIIGNSASTTVFDDEESAEQAIRESRHPAFVNRIEYQPGKED